MNRYSMLKLLVPLSATILLVGCASTTGKIEKTSESYYNVGKAWGNKHFAESIQPGKIDSSFVTSLVNRNNLDFFWINTDLKNSFKKGYRSGYEDRTADLVLGPHFEKAAILMGSSISSDFVEVINCFETNWVKTLREAIDVFIVLISEGSQADREGFINEFSKKYTKKYKKNIKTLGSGKFISQTSEGGTKLHIDMTKVKAVLDIPSPTSLKSEIYHQTFKVMGDEMGRRYSHNLISRTDLIDWLRRSKSALKEVGGDNLGIITNAFVESYGTDARNVFSRLLKEANIY